MKRLTFLVGLLLPLAASAQLIISPIGGGGAFDPAAPGAIGGTTPAAGSFTTLSASGSAGVTVRDANAVVVGGILAAQKNDGTELWRFGLRPISGSLTNNLNFSNFKSIGSVWQNVLTLHDTSGGVSIGTATDPGAGNLLVNGSVSTITPGSSSVSLGSLFAPSLSGGQYTNLNIGVAAATNNSVGLTFNYTSSGSTSNSFGFGLYGQYQQFVQKGDGTTYIGTGAADATAAGMIAKFASGGSIFSAPVRLKGYTVATLPAGTQGDTAFVTDALTPVFLDTVVGGGAVVSTVFYNGTNWIAQ